MKYVLLALLAVGVAREALATWHVSKPSHTILQAGEGTITDFEVVAVLDDPADPNIVYLLISACGQGFRFKLLRAQLEDEIILEQIIDYISAKCASTSKTK